MLLSEDAAVEAVISIRIPQNLGRRLFDVAYFRSAWDESKAVEQYTRARLLIELLMIYGMMVNRSIMMNCIMVISNLAPIFREYFQ